MMCYHCPSVSFNDKIMESLLTYGNDSDSQEEEDEHEETTSEGLSLSNKALPQKLVGNLCAEENTLKSHKSEISDKHITSFNFLGLEMAGTIGSSIFTNTRTHNVEKESRMVKTNSGEVEIPSGDFWRDFIPDCTSVATTQGADYPQRQAKEMVVHKNVMPETLSAVSYHQKSLKRLFSDTNLGSVGKQIKLCDQSLDHSCDFIGHPDDLVNLKQRDLSYSSANSQQITHFGCPDKNVENQMLTSEKRKIFYIHSKVAPYVNSKPVNKCASKLLQTWPAHDGVVNRLAWNVPSFSHLLLTCGMDTCVRVWNVWSSLDPCVTCLSSHKKAVKHAEWCHTGRKVLSCSYDRTAQVTDVETTKILGQYEHMSFVTAGCMHPANPNLFVTGMENMILKWDLRTPQAPVRCFSYKDKFGQVQDLLFIRNGQEFVSCSDLISRDSADRTLMIWDLRSGTVLSNQIFQERYMCTRLKLHSNNSVFMAQTQGDYVALFSTTAPYKMDKSKRYEGHKTEGHNIGFDISSDGTLVYSGSARDGIYCYHQQSGRLIRKLPRKETITDVACHPVLPSLVASSSWGGNISLWT